MFVVVGVAAVEKSVVITAVETILFDDGVVLDEVTGGDGVFDEVTGDGIDDNGVGSILWHLMSAGFSSDNIATFGMGGGLLQKINRDTQRCAFKSCYQIKNGVGHDIFKKPKDATKVSKRGQLKLVWDEVKKEHVTVNISDPRPDVLVTVFEDGELTKFYNFDEVRANSLL